MLKNISIFGFVMCSLLMLGEASAQEWPINNPPVDRPVPQYRPSAFPQGQRSMERHPFAQHAQPNQPTRPVQRQPQTPAKKVVPNKAPIKTPAMTKKSPETAKGKRAAGKDADSKKKQLSRYGLDYSIYRDRNPYPIDPRKPCVTCTHPQATAPTHKFAFTGYKGRPHKDKEPGGCLCNKKSCPKCKRASVYWPRPFSTLLEEKFPDRVACRDLNFGQKRPVDFFDHLVDFKLVDYQRRDNAFCGKGADPYGCLGESKTFVSGIGFRPPGEPVVQPAPFNVARDYQRSPWR